MELIPENLSLWTFFGIQIIPTNSLNDHERGFGNGLGVLGWVGRAGFIFVSTLLNIKIIYSH